LLGVRHSGEEKQVDFTGSGTILVQSSEEPLAGRSDLPTILAQVSGLRQGDLQAVQAHIAQKLRGQ
jgi:hypothetical protein